jgi:hypothetical protein
MGFMPGGILSMGVSFGSLVGGAMLPLLIKISGIGKPRDRSACHAGLAGSAGGVGLFTARGPLRPSLRSFALDFAREIAQIAAIMAVKTSEAPRLTRPLRFALAHQEPFER